MSDIARRAGTRIFISTVAVLLLSGCAGFKIPNSAQRDLSIEQRWARNTNTALHFGFRPENTISPLITSDLVIQGNAVDGIVAYRRRTASVAWRLPLKGGLEGGATISGDGLFFGANDGRFYKVDLVNGQILWTAPLQSEIVAQPVVDGTRVYVLAGNHILHALDAESGKSIWFLNRQDRADLTVRGGARPIIHNELIYAGFSDGSLVALNKITGEVKWEIVLNRNKKFRDLDAGPVLDQERVFVVGYDDALYCLEAGTGRVIWKTEGGSGSSVTIGEQAVYYSSGSSIAAVDRRSGKMLWSYDKVEGLATQPVLYRGLLIFGQSEGPVQVLAAETGAPEAAFVTGRGQKAAPTIDIESGEAYVFSVDSNLYALRLAWKAGVDRWPWER